MRDRIEKKEEEEEREKKEEKEGGEGGLHGGASMSDQAIVAFEPGRQVGMMLVGPTHTMRGFTPLAFSRARLAWVSEAASAQTTASSPRIKSSAGVVSLTLAGVVSTARITPEPS